ncbi:MAG: hypothetical protein AVDCRST_MAG59-897, partial [uncultured Thermomicrobiales bacterium]
GPDQHLPHLRAELRGSVHLLQVRLRHRVRGRHHALRRRADAGRPAGGHRRRQEADREHPAADPGRPPADGLGRPGRARVSAQPGEQRADRPRSRHPGLGRRAVRCAGRWRHRQRPPGGGVLGGLLRLPGRPVRHPLARQLHEQVV